MFNPWHDLAVDPENAHKAVTAVIEIPAGSTIKYELDKASGMMRVDRIMSSAVYYPANYGFIPRSYCDDNDPLDILVLGQVSVVPGCIMDAKPIGVMHMIDGGEGDDKIIAVHADDPIWKGYNELSEVPEHLLKQIEQFFVSYKALEKKAVEVNGFSDRVRALEIIKESFDLYLANETELRAKG